MFWPQFSIESDVIWQFVSSVVRITPRKIYSMQHNILVPPKFWYFEGLGFLRYFNSSRKNIQFRLIFLVKPIIWEPLILRILKSIFSQKYATQTRFPLNGTPKFQTPHTIGGTIFRYFEVSAPIEGYFNSSHKIFIAGPLSPTQFGLLIFDT